MKPIRRNHAPFCYVCFALPSRLQDPDRDKIFMPEIQIRPVISSDIPALVALDHHFSSDHIWQLDLQVGRIDESSGEPVRAASFRQVRLPRSVRVEYPRPQKKIMGNWTYRSGLL